jgi:hypothetical protein
LWCVVRLPTVIKETLEKYNNNDINDIKSALIESFEKADKGKINCNYIYCNYN